MRMRALVATTCTAAVIGFSSIAAAQGKSAPKVKTTAGGAPKAGHTTVAHGKSVTYKPASSPKTTAGSKNTTAAAKSTPRAGQAKTKTTEAKATGRTKTSTTSPATTTTSTPTGTTTTGTTTLTPVQQKLERNTNLAAKLQSRLPAGTDLNTAAAGFRNLGQFVAAVNVSNNLGLDFTTLKTAIVTDGKSLGQAIQAQKGTTVYAAQQAQTAERDADTLIRSTEPKARTSSTGRPRQ